MSNADSPTPAKGRLTITVNTASLREDDGTPADDDHTALVKTLNAVVEKVKQDLPVLPYPGGEWITEKHPAQTSNGTATITLS